MYKQIAKVNYNWGTRYWCFGDAYVVDAYDEVDGVITRNHEIVWAFDDMDVDELIGACRDKYTLTLYPQSYVNKLLCQLCANL